MRSEVSIPPEGLGTEVSHVHSQHGYLTELSRDPELERASPTGSPSNMPSCIILGGINAVYDSMERIRLDVVHL